MTETSFKKDRESLFTCLINDFDPYIKGLEQYLEQARSQSKLDWESEIQTEIVFCRILKTKRQYIELVEMIEKTKTGKEHLFGELEESVNNLEMMGVDTENLISHFRSTGEIL